jgi:hypothetical protein
MWVWNEPTAPWVGIQQWSQWKERAVRLGVRAILVSSMWKFLWWWCEGVWIGMEGWGESGERCDEISDIQIKAQYGNTTDAPHFDPPESRRVVVEPSLHLHVRHVPGCIQQQQVGLDRSDVAEEEVDDGGALYGQGCSGAEEGSGGEVVPRDVGGYERHSGGLGR